MPRKLKNLTVSYVSLVDKGANQKQIIMKSADGGSLIKTITIVKQDKLKKVAYGIVYPAGEVDAHGDYADAETVEKACYEFMKALNLHNIDKQHNLVKQDAYVAENWIVRKGDALFPDDENAWAMGIKIEDDALWKSLEDGEITGFSLYGMAEAIQEDDVEKSMLQKIMKAFGLAKDFNGEQYLKDINSMIWALQDCIWVIGKNDVTLEDIKAKVKENVAQFQEAITSISKSLQLDQKAIENLEKSIGSLEKTQNEESNMTEEQVKKMIDDALAKQAETLQKAEAERMQKIEEQLKNITAELAKSASNPQDNPPEEEKYV